MNTPVLGSMSQRDNVFLTVVDTLSTIITSMKHLRDIGQYAIQ